MIQVIDKIIKYKNFTAIVEYSEEDKLFFGTLVLEMDDISFHANSENDLKKEFHNCVDNRMIFYNKLGKTPLTES